VRRNPRPDGSETTHRQDTSVEVAIPRSPEALVRRKVEEGHYSTEDEVVADALRLMQARDEVVALKRARLKDAIDRGYEDAAARRVIQLETDDEIDALFASL
jgi:putative addiction module CopG family antidote